MNLSGKVECCSLSVTPTMHVSVDPGSSLLYTYVSFECETCNRKSYLKPREGQTLADALDEIASYPGKIYLVKATL